MATTKTRKRVKTQSVRTRTTYGTVKIRGRLESGQNGKHTYLVIETPTGEIDFLDGTRLYRLAKAIVTRFETATT